MTKELTKQQQNELNILKGWILKWAKLLKISRYGKNFGIEQFYKKLYGYKSGNGYSIHFTLEDIEKLKKAQKEFLEPIKLNPVSSTV